MSKHYETSRYVLESEQVKLPEKVTEPVVIYHPKQDDEVISDFVEHMNETFGSPEEKGAQP